MKLKTVFILLLLTMTGLASANSKDKQASLSPVFKKVAEVAKVNKGITMTAEDILPEKNSKQLAKNLYRDWNTDAYQGGCRYRITVGQKHALNLLLSKVKDKVTYRSLASKTTAKDLSNVVSVEWDGNSGKRSFCDVNSVYLYGKKGEFLYLEYKN